MTHSAWHARLLVRIGLGQVTQPRGELAGVALAARHRRERAPFDDDVVCHDEVVELARAHVLRLVVEAGQREPELGLLLGPATFDELARRGELANPPIDEARHPAGVGVRLQECA